MLRTQSPSTRTANRNSHCGPGLSLSRLLAMLVASLALFSQAAAAVTLDFNNTVADGDANGVNPSYTTGDYTLTALDSTSIYLLDSNFDTSNAPPDNSDFFTIEGGSPSSVELTSSAGTLTLQSFRASAIYDNGAGDLTVTANVSGGGTLTEVFALPSGDPDADWNTYSLPANWTGLTSVTFSWEDAFAGLDDIVVDSTPTAVPMLPLWALSLLSGLLVLLAGRKARRQR